MSALQWYYRLDGQAHGPFTAVQFEKLIRGKTVTPATYVSTDGKIWRPFRDILAGVPAEQPTYKSNTARMNEMTLLPGEYNPPSAPSTEPKKPES